VAHHHRDLDPGAAVLPGAGVDHQGTYVTGAGTDAHTLIAIGAVLELLLLIANVGRRWCRTRSTSASTKPAPSPR
jgi:adenine deaminase